MGETRIFEQMDGQIQDIRADRDSFWQIASTTIPLGAYQVVQDLRPSSVSRDPSHAKNYIQKSDKHSPVFAAVSRSIVRSAHRAILSAVFHTVHSSAPS